VVLAPCAQGSTWYPCKKKEGLYTRDLPPLFLPRPHFEELLEIDRLNSCLIPTHLLKHFLPARSQIRQKHSKLPLVSWLIMADALKAEGNKAIAEKNFDEAM
jgi:hypothetical protein